MFRIVEYTLGEGGEVVARCPLQPLFEIWEDAIAMAEFESSRLEASRYDGERNCWYAKDTCGQIYRFEIEEVSATDAAA